MRAPFAAATTSRTTLSRKDVQAPGFAPRHRYPEPYHRKPHLCPQAVTLAGVATEEPVAVASSEQSPGMATPEDLVRAYQLREPSVQEESRVARVMQTGP